MAAGPALKFMVVSFPVKQIGKPDVLFKPQVLVPAG
jgi:hypothetical protein